MELLLLPVKVLFLVAAFWMWNTTDNEKCAAAAWASFSFLVNLFVVGFTKQLPLYGITAFVVAWAMFYGLGYLRGSSWLWPAAGCGALVLVFFT